jgi:hypothetical protein
MTKLELATKAADLAARATVAQIQAKQKACIISHELASQAIKLRAKVDAKAAPTNRAKRVAETLEVALRETLAAREGARASARASAVDSEEKKLTEIIGKIRTQLKAQRPRRK